MSSPALSQLLCTGPQDGFLTKKPEVSFMHHTFNRHTDFAKDNVDQTFNGSMKAGNRVTVDIPRNADMIHTITLAVEMTATGPTYFPVEELIRNVELKIGGQVVDNVTHHVFRLYDQLFRTDAERSAYRAMANFPDEEQAAASPANPIKRLLRLPLIFWFNNDMQKSLPINLMAYHTLSLDFHLSERVKNVDLSQDIKMNLNVDYIYLTQDERRSMARVLNSNHLITAWQYITTETVNLPAPGASAGEMVVPIKTAPSHPIKTFFVFMTGKPYGATNNAYPFIRDAADDLATLTSSDSRYNDTYSPIKAMTIKMNNQDRVAERPGSYFSQQEASYKFRTIPEAGVLVWSLAEYPTNLQPSSALNGGRVDSLAFVIRTKEVVGTAFNAGQIAASDKTVANRNELNTVHVIGHHLNMLMFRNGMAALLFSS